MTSTKTLKETRNERGSRFLSGFTNNFLRDFFIDPTSIDTPASNVSENKKEFKIELGIPYFEREDLEVILDSSNLIVLGFNKSKESENGEGQRVKEIGIDNREPSNIALRKTFQLPEIVDRGKIVAEYKDDILHIYLPKKESFQEKPTVIEIS